jgi:hypothetical protein
MRRLALLALFVTGCATGNVVMVDGIEIYERVWERTKDELGRRAAAELNCGTIDFQLIRREGREPVEVLVRGCARRAMYVRPTAHLGGYGYGGYRAMGSWQLTTLTNDAAEPVPSAPVRRGEPPPPPPVPQSI